MNKQIEGEWIVKRYYHPTLKMNLGTYTTCSNCGRREIGGPACFAPTKYCPDCGSRNSIRVIDVYQEENEKHEKGGAE